MKTKQRILKMFSMILMMAMLITSIPLGICAADADHPFESIEVEDISIIEGTNGGDTGSYFYYEMTGIDVTATLKDGTVKKLNLDPTFEFQEDGRWYRLATNAGAMQIAEHWTAGNTYTVTATLVDITTTFEVTILPSHVESFEIQDMTIVENTNGYHNGQYFMYELYNNLNTSVTLTDGTLKNGTGSSVEIDGKWYSISVDSYVMQYAKPWTAGNTYTVTATLMGVTTTFDVTITAAPVVSLDVEDITIMVGTNGYNDGGAFVYYLSNVLKGSATLNDGTVKEIDGSGLEIGGQWYSISTNEYDLQWGIRFWTVGNTYTVTATLMGVSDTFNVTIVESPVESIEVKDVSIIENTDGYYSGDQFMYSIYNMDVTITMKDGTVYKTNGGLELDGNWYGISTDVLDTQYSSPWYAGNTYTVTATLIGVSDTFDVTILETPVANVVVKDIVLYEGIDGSAMMQYDLFPKTDEIVMKDGSAAEIVNNGANVLYEGVYYSVSTNANNLQNMSPWMPGNTYEVTGWILGCITTFNVTILENPIKNLELITMPERLEYLVGDSLDLKGATIRVNYKDGTYEDIVLNDTYNYDYNRVLKLKNINKAMHIEMPYVLSAAGAYTVQFALAGVACEVPIVVRDNTIVSASIREEADHSIVITVNLSDNSSYEMRLLDIYRILGVGIGDYEESVFTDKGQFDMKFYVSENSFAVGLKRDVYDYEYSIKTNSISSSQWYEVATSKTYGTINYIAGFRYVGEKKLYDGAITVDNIDIIIELAGACDDLWFDEDRYIENHYEIGYCLFTGDDIRYVVKKYFGIDNIDLSVSKNYDPESDIYTYVKMGAGGWKTVSPNNISYDEGVWTVKTALGTTEGTISTHSITFNDDLQITSFCINETYSSDKPSSVTSSVHTVNEGYISKIAIGTTVAELLSGLNEGTLCKVYKGETIVDDNALVGTGMVVKLMDGDAVVASYEVVVTGDVTGDGKINAFDLISLKNHLKGSNVLKGAYAKAADVDGTNTATAFDSIKMKSYIRGNGNITVK